MDLTMALPESTNGFDTILAVMCKFSKKKTHAKTMQKDRLLENQRRKNSC